MAISDMGCVIKLDLLVRGFPNVQVLCCDPRCRPGCLTRAVKAQELALS